MSKKDFNYREYRRVKQCGNCDNSIKIKGRKYLCSKLDDGNYTPVVEHARCDMFIPEGL